MRCPSRSFPNQADENYMYQIPIPTAVQEDDKSIELLRLFAKSEGQEFAINVHYKDPAAWGILISDLLHHLAWAYERKGHDPDLTFRRILEALNAELEETTEGSATEDQGT